MFTIYEEIESGWAKAYENIRLSEDERGSFTEFISDEEGQARTKAIVDLQPWLAIFELGIEWLSYVHVALTNDLERKSGDSRYRATWALVGSAVSFGLSIRLLCISGFDTPAKALLQLHRSAFALLGRAGRQADGHSFCEFRDRRASQKLLAFYGVA